MSQEEYATVSEQIKGLTTLINAQFNIVHERLDKINGKVARHDEQITEALIERAKNREEQKSIVPNHILNCPRAKDIENVYEKTIEIEKKLEDAFFFLKHPKLFIATLAIIVILTLATFIETNPLKVFEKFKPQIENTK